MPPSTPSSSAPSLTSTARDADRYAPLGAPGGPRVAASAKSREALGIHAPIVEAIAAFADAIGPRLGITVVERALELFSPADGSDSPTLMLRFRVRTERDDLRGRFWDCLSDHLVDLAAQDDAHREFLEHELSVVVSA